MQDAIDQLVETRKAHLQDAPTIAFITTRIADIEAERLRGVIGVDRQNELQFLCRIRDKMAAEAPLLPIRDTTTIDAELILTTRLYIMASKAGIHEATLMVIFAKVAALVWVLHPELNEVGAQGWAWELIAGIKDEEGA